MHDLILQDGLRMLFAANQQVRQIGILIVIFDSAAVDA